MRDSIHLSASSPITFASMYSALCHMWTQELSFDRGEVHAQKVTEPHMVTRELRDVVLDIKVPDYQPRWAEIVQPNLPWAEDHFQERVGGEPLNPPPQEANWPFAQQGNSAHKKGEKFSHTYPERFWPKHAGDVPNDPGFHCGIRFEYGDLMDLVQVLIKNPRSRQAYLPVWFPEDLTAAVQGERVPCTLGYHIMLHPDNKFHMTYHMRSCDLVRFMRDDIYMAGRLLQWVTEEVNAHLTLAEEFTPGGLRLTIGSLHAFQGDETWLEGEALKSPLDKRAHYNLDALG